MHTGTKEVDQMKVNLQTFADELLNSKLAAQSTEESLGEFHARF